MKIDLVMVLRTKSRVRVFKIMREHLERKVLAKRLIASESGTNFSEGKELMQARVSSKTQHSVTEEET